MNLSVRQIRAFVAVATRRSFTKAAEDLSVTQAAVSGLIKELEESAGIQLIERGHQIRLTAAGKNFFQVAQRVLMDLESASSEFKHLSRGLRGRVSVAAGHLVALTFLPPALQRFRKSYPNVDVEIVDRPSHSIVSTVRSAEADFGIAMDQPAPPDIERRVLLNEEIVLVCSAQHRFARARAVSWQEVCGELMIVVNSKSGTWQMAEQHLASLGLAVDRSLEVTHSATAAVMVATSDAVTLLPRSCQSFVEALGGVTRFVREPMLTRALSLFTRRSSIQSAPTKALIEEMISEVRANAVDVTGGTI
jgi:LysR family carnitine catabolism transcriptional activator